jgi:inorganic phosphate transporter, PiT family
METAAKRSSFNMDLVTLAVVAIVLALAFDFVNGFHDTANACSTVIYSGALTPKVAIANSAFWNFLGAATAGTGVAIFVVKIVTLKACTMPMLLAVLLAGLVWNVLTWYKGLPVSSSHCMIGSLVGAGLASVGMAGVNFHKLNEALVALVVSPVVGFAVALVVTWLFKQWISRGITGPAMGLVDETEKKHHKTFRWLQVLSSTAVSYSHGSNDGQKTMGLITLILATQFASKGYTLTHVPFWVILSAASAIGLGTAVGGGRIIKTVGEHLSFRKITSLDGCAAEFTTAVTVFTASKIGVPVSTTHVLSSAVGGSTAGLHGTKAINMQTYKKILLAWVLTFPVTIALGYVFCLVTKLILG